MAGGLTVTAAGLYVVRSAVRGSEPWRATLIRRAQHDGGAGGDIGCRPDLLEQLLERERRRDAYLQDVALLAGHRVTGFDLLQVGQLFRRVIGRRRVDGLDRDERGERQTDGLMIEHRGVSPDHASL